MNPFQAILSWYRDNTVGFHSHSDMALLARQHSSQEDTSIFSSKQFERFTMENIVVWRKIIEDWVIVGDFLVVHFENVLRGAFKMKQQKPL